jgi:N-acetylglutamate synthase-like GNAT family acetyltransferase
MDIHQELTPWLASVYVERSSRRKGIGSMLVQHVMQTAKAADISHLYLFTPDQQRFYKRLGWNELIHENYREHCVTIMSVEL